MFETGEVGHDLVKGLGQMVKSRKVWVVAGGHGARFSQEQLPEYRHLAGKGFEVGGWVWDV